MSCCATPRPCSIRSTPPPGNSPACPPRRARCAWAGSPARAPPAAPRPRGPAPRSPRHHRRHPGRQHPRAGPRLRAGPSTWAAWPQRRRSAHPTQNPPHWTSGTRRTQPVPRGSHRRRSPARTQPNVADLRGQRWIAAPSPQTDTDGVWPGLGGDQITHAARDWMTKLHLVAAGCGLTACPPHSRQSGRRACGSWPCAAGQRKQPARHPDPAPAPAHRASQPPSPTPYAPQPPTPQPRGSSSVGVYRDLQGVSKQAAAMCAPHLPRPTSSSRVSPVPEGKAVRHRRDAILFAQPYRLHGVGVGPSVEHPGSHQPYGPLDLEVGAAEGEVPTLPSITKPTKWYSPPTRKSISQTSSSLGPNHRSTCSGFVSTSKTEPAGASNCRGTRTHCREIRMSSLARSAAGCGFHRALVRDPLAKVAGTRTGSRAGRWLSHPAGTGSRQRRCAQRGPGGCTGTGGYAALSWQVNGRGLQDGDGRGPPA